MTKFHYNEETLLYEPIEEDHNTFTVVFLILGVFALAAIIFYIGFSTPSKPVKFEISCKQEKVIEKPKDLNTRNIIKELIRHRIQHPEIALAQIWMEVGHKYEGIKEPGNLYNMEPALLRPATYNGKGKRFATYYNWSESITDYAFWQYQNAWGLSRKNYLKRLAKTFCPDPGYSSNVESLIAKAESEITAYKLSCLQTIE